MLFCVVQFNNKMEKRKTLKLLSVEAKKNKKQNKLFQKYIYLNIHMARERLQIKEVVLFISLFLLLRIIFVCVCAWVIIATKQNNKKMSI